MQSDPISMCVTPVMGPKHFAYHNSPLLGGTRRHVQHIHLELSAVMSCGARSSHICRDVKSIQEPSGCSGSSDCRGSTKTNAFRVSSVMMIFSERWKVTYCLFRKWQLCWVVDVTSSRHQEPPALFVRPITVRVGPCNWPYFVDHHILDPISLNQH